MSAGGYLNGCGFIPSAGGTADFAVSAAVQGYATPANAGAVNGTVYTYRAESADKSQWEIGFGAYTSSGTTLARTTVLMSSTGSKVSFSAAPNVYVTAAAADLQNASLLTSGTVGTARLGSGTANSGSFLRGDQTWQTMPVVKAAVFYTWNGSAVTIVNSFNVSSVVRTSSGLYTVNFTAAFADANYYPSVLVDSRAATNGWSQINSGSGGTNKTTSACPINFVTVSGGALAAVDPPAAYAEFKE